MKDNNSDDDKPKVSENRRLWENVWDKVICAQEVWSEMVRLSIISSLMDLSLHNQVIHETDTGFMKEPDKDFRCIFLMFCQTSSGKD